MCEHIIFWNVQSQLIRLEQSVLLVRTTNLLVSSCCVVILYVIQLLSWRTKRTRPSRNQEEKGHQSSHIENFRIILRTQLTQSTPSSSYGRVRTVESRSRASCSCVLWTLGCCCQAGSSSSLALNGTIRLYAVCFLVVAVAVHLQLGACVVRHLDKERVRSVILIDQNASLRR